MDGFTGFKTAAAEEIPAAVAVMDPFHVVRLAGDALDKAGVGSTPRSTATAVTRTTRSTPPGGPCTPAPTYSPTSRRTDSPPCSPPKSTSKSRLWGDLPADDRRLPSPGSNEGARADAEPDRVGQRRRVPAALSEVITLGRTLKKRAVDVLAYFDRPGTSNGPTEAINGRPNNSRGSALGFRNFTNYIARSLLETGGFRPLLHPEL